jgi:hypothetical protein
MSIAAKAIGYQLQRISMAQAGMTGDSLGPIYQFVPAVYTQGQEKSYSVELSSLEDATDSLSINTGLVLWKKIIPKTKGRLSSPIGIECESSSNKSSVSV